MSLQISVLPNGLRVATDTMAEAESVVIGAWVGVGTRHEAQAANGVAHLVEHMMFKGTKKRSAFDLSAAIERNGGGMNAHTSREETAYYARVLPEDAELATDIIADMLLRSRLAPAELDRERQVIIQEIGRDRDTPEDHISDLLYSTAFPKQRLGRPILGTAEIIARLPRKALTDYIERYYHADNMVLVGAGKIAHAEMVRLATRYFGKLPRGKKPKADPARLGKGELRVDQDTEQLHLIMAFGGPGRLAPSIHTANLLGILLGGNASSRLFQKVREERGLVYSVSANTSVFQDSGLFEIYAGTDPARVRELIPVVCRELRAVTRSITRDELDRAKAQIRADYLMGQESVMRRAEQLGHQMIMRGKPVDPRKILDRVMKVSVDETCAMAQKLFAKPLILTALGPHKDLESYDKIAARLV